VWLECARRPRSKSKSRKSPALLPASTIARQPITGKSPLLQQSKPTSLLGAAKGSSGLAGVWLRHCKLLRTANVSWQLFRPGSQMLLYIPDRVLTHRIDVSVCSCPESARPQGWHAPRLWLLISTCGQHAHRDSQRRCSAESRWLRAAMTPQPTCLWIILCMYK
jgi:hypothetical protein